MRPFSFKEIEEYLKSAGVSDDLCELEQSRVTGFRREPDSVIARVVDADQTLYFVLLPDQKIDFDLPDKLETACSCSEASAAVFIA